MVPSIEFDRLTFGRRSVELVLRSEPRRGLAAGQRRGTRRGSGDVQFARESLKAGSLDLCTSVYLLHDVTGFVLSLGFVEELVGNGA